MNTVKKTLSWGWIIFWLIIFWPVGLFFLVRKIATDKSALMSGKTGVFSVIGWILAVVGGFLLLVFLTEPEPGGLDMEIILFALAFLVGGVLLLLKVSHTKRTAKKYKKYINIVVNHNEKSIDNIASAVGVTYDAAIKDLKKMIDIGYFGGAFINQVNREIILHRPEPIAQTFVGGHAAPQMTTINCKGCGANGVVTVGVITACEYCGSPNEAPANLQTAAPSTAAPQAFSQTSAPPPSAIPMHHQAQTFNPQPFNPPPPKKSKGWIIALSILGGLLIIGFLASLSDTDTSEQVSTVANVEETTNLTTEQSNAMGAYVTERVLFNQEDVTVTLKSLSEQSGRGVQIHVLIENDSDVPITLQVRDVSVNGIMFKSPIFSSPVTPGNRSNDRILLHERDLERYGITEIGTVELRFRVINSEDWGVGFNTELIRIETSAAGQFEQELPATRELLYESESLTVSLVDIVDAQGGFNGVNVLLLIENSTERTVTILTREEAVNGFMVSGTKVATITPGNLSIEPIFFSEGRLEANGIGGAEDIETVQFVLSVGDDYDRDWTFTTSRIEITR